MGNVNPPELMLALIEKAKVERSFIFWESRDMVLAGQEGRWFHPDNVVNLWNAGLVYWGEGRGWSLRDPQFFINVAMKKVEKLNSQAIELKIDISEAVKFMTGKTKGQQDEDYFVTFPD